MENKVKEKGHKILVVGSSNTDMVIQAEHLPSAGETIIGKSFFMNPGGKGANQAVAVARLGGQTTFVCKTGNDMFGLQSQKLLKEEGIDTSHIFTDDKNPSGVALITVDDNAENCIVVASGSNWNLTPKDMEGIDEVIRENDYILMQLEIPMETVEYVAKRAFGLGKKVILNPAPAHSLTKELLSHLYMITPNETEAEMISGVKITDEESALDAARALAKVGVQNVIITLGSKGSMIFNDDKSTLIPALKVKAVDTTAAGDVFNGALVVGLANDMTIADAARFDTKAAAISVTRMGARDSAPYLNEIS